MGNDSFQLAESSIIHLTQQYVNQIKPLILDPTLEMEEREFDLFSSAYRLLCRANELIDKFQDLAVLKYDDLSDDCWVLVDPNGAKHSFTALTPWLLQNYKKFGCNSEDDIKQLSHDLRAVARYTSSGKPGRISAHGWLVERRPARFDATCAKKWELTSPDGQIIHVYNLRKWVSENVKVFGFSDTSKTDYICRKLYQVCIGKAYSGKCLLSYKGWKIKEC